MGIDYTLLVSALLYFFVVKIFVSSKLSIVSASLIVVLGSFGFSLLTRWIILSSYGVSAFELISVSAILTVILQLMAAVFVFYKLQETEESYVAWMGWSILGFVALFFAIPAISTTFVALF